MIGHGCALAQLAERELEKLPDREIVFHAQLGIVNFHYAPAEKSGAELNEQNRQISKELTSGGYAQIFTTEPRGKTVLRMCPINPQTTEANILHTMRRLEQCQVIRKL